MAADDRSSDDEDEVVIIRTGTRDVDEAKLFYKYVNTASEGLITKLFGRHGERIMSGLYLTSGHMYGHDTCRFAVVRRKKKKNHGDCDEEVIVGMTHSYSGRVAKDSSNYWPWIKQMGLRIVEFVWRGWSYRKAFEHLEQIEEDDYYLEAIAIEESARGRGIGSKLIDDVHIRARELGCTRVVLDVSSTNPNAKRLYERRGMTVDFPSPIVHGYYYERMVQDVKPAPPSPGATGNAM